MPVTPFHFGPAILAKAIAPRHFSLIAFGVTQVLIDLETVYNIVNGRYPLHRELHTFLVGTTASTILGLLLGFLATRPLQWEWWARLRRLPGELTPAGCVVGGIFGGASHALLDGIMHPDSMPFLPWMGGNPLLHVIDVWSLHLLCVATGLVGALLLAARFRAGA